MAGKKVNKVPLGTGMLSDAAKIIRDRKKRMAEELGTAAPKRKKKTKHEAIGGGFDRYVPQKKKK